MGWFHKRWSWTQDLQLSYKSAYDLVKIKNQGRKKSNKQDGISQKNQNVSIFFRLPLQLQHLRASENQIVGVGRGSGGINQSQCSFLCLVIGLVLLSQHATPTT